MWSVNAFTQSSIIIQSKDWVLTLTFNCATETLLCSSVCVCVCERYSLGCRLYPELLWLAVLAPALVPVTVGRFSRLGKAKGRETGVIPPSIPKFSGRFGAPGPSRLALDDGTCAPRNAAT